MSRSAWRSRASRSSIAGPPRCGRGVRPRRRTRARGSRRRAVNAAWPARAAPGACRASGRASVPASVSSGPHRPPVGAGSVWLCWSGSPQTALGGAVLGVVAGEASRAADDLRRGEGRLALEGLFQHAGDLADVDDVELERPRARDVDRLRTVGAGQTEEPVDGPVPRAHEPPGTPPATSRSNDLK